MYTNHTILAPDAALKAGTEFIVTNIRTVASVSTHTYVRISSNR